jgi:hypothetical protein
MTKAEKGDVRILIKALEEAAGLLADSGYESAIEGAAYINGGLDIAAKLRPKVYEAI